MITDFNAFLDTQLEDLKQQGLSFPEVEDPGSIYYCFDEKLNNIFIETMKILANKDNFKYARYMPLLYLKDDIPEFEKTSQRNMGRFMKLLLIKRLESSFFAFKKTLDRFIKSYDSVIKGYEKGYVYMSKKYLVKVESIRYYYYKVEAESEEQARELVDRDEAGEVYDSSDGGGETTVTLLEEG